MKKFCLALLVILSLSAMASSAQRPAGPLKSLCAYDYVKEVANKPAADTAKPAVQEMTQQPQFYIVQGTIGDWQTLLNTIESAEPKHRQVLAIKSWIVQQLNMQIDALQKQAAEKKTPKK